jgi:hypothetical protein
MVTTTPVTALHAPGTLGALNYMAPSVISSLYRNGNVLTRRDRDGNDAGTEGASMVELELVVNDARRLDRSQRRTIETHGFQLFSRPLACPDLDFYDHQQVVQEYYAECARIVQEATGVARVFAFDHNIRSEAGKKSKKRIAGGQEVQEPAHDVHADYTLTQRTAAFARPGKAAERQRYAALGARRGPSPSRSR